MAIGLTRFTRQTSHVCELARRRSARTSSPRLQRARDGRYHTVCPLSAVIGTKPTPAHVYDPRKTVSPAAAADQGNRCRQRVRVGPEFRFPMRIDEIAAPSRHRSRVDTELGALSASRRYACCALAGTDRRGRLQDWGLLAMESAK